MVRALMLNPIVLRGSTRGGRGPKVTPSLGRPLSSPRSSRVPRPILTLKFRPGWRACREKRSGKTGGRTMGVVSPRGVGACCRRLGPQSSFAGWWPCERAGGPRPWAYAFAASCPSVYVPEIPSRVYTRDGISDWGETDTSGQQGKRSTLTSPCREPRPVCTRGAEFLTLAGTQASFMSNIPARVYTRDEVSDGSGIYCVPPTGKTCWERWIRVGSCMTCAHTPRDSRHGSCRRVPSTWRQ